MSNKTRVLNVRVVGFSAPERQMLNSIFLLSVAPARQIGYKLWNPEAGTAPDMYLLDGDSESAVASWQATFASTSDRTLVVGSKNLDLGVASASRPLGLKVVGAMDRLAIALNNVALASQARESTAGLDASEPRAGRTLPTSAPETTAPKQEQTLARVTSGMTSQQPALSASMNAMAPMSAAANTLAPASNTIVDRGKYPVRGGADPVFERARGDRERLRCGAGERHAHHDDGRGARRHRAAQHDAATECDAAAQRAVLRQVAQ